MDGVWKRAGFLVCAAASALCLGGCSHKEASWEKGITEETIYIEGLEGEYTFLFLTDSHVVIQDDSDSEQERQYAAQRYDQFVNKEGVSSAEQFPEWIAYANEMGVDAVLLGGDIIDSPSNANVEWLQEQLAELEMPYLYVPGNHDWTYPWEYMTDYGKENYMAELGSMMQANTAVHSIEVGELLLAGVDNSPGQVNPDAMSVYEQLLTQNKPMILLFHVPYTSETLLPKALEAWNSPTVIGNGDQGGIWPDETSQRFLELATADDSPVRLMLAGHVHLYDNSVIDEDRHLCQIVGDAAYEGRAVLIRITGEEAS